MISLRTGDPEEQLGGVVFVQGTDKVWLQAGQAGVQIDIVGQTVKAKGKKGELSLVVHDEIAVSKDGETVDGKSIIGLMMLAAACGSSIEVEAQGPDAEAAVAAIAVLIENRFNEE